MEKIIKILKKSSFLNVHKSKDLQIEYRTMCKEFNKYGISSTYNDDRSFFELEIIYTSLINKQVFEQHYENLKSELIEIWPYFEYEERKKCIDKEMLKAKISTKYFQNDQGKTIRIAFFDELLNSLYENEMIIFDLPQYFKLEKVFNDRMDNVNNYSYKPYQAGFSSCVFLERTADGYVIFNKFTKSMYINFFDRGYYQFPFDRHKDERYFQANVLHALAKAILTGTNTQIIDELVKSHLCSVYIDRLLIEYRNQIARRG
ncbi:MAG: hypothetical protein VB012_01815 [Erysipelotrichaceae bacterium]|nr:hypothetical protein [Erysipelotrichaceae bacterium]